MRDLLARNYDVVGTISTAGVLLVLDAPWPFWIVWGALATYQVANRWRFRHGVEA